MLGFCKFYVRIPDESIIQLVSCIEVFHPFGYEPTLLDVL